MFTIISINNDASLKLSQNAGKIATASTIIALVAGILAYSLLGGPGSFLPTTPAAGYITTVIALLFVFDAIRYMFIYKRSQSSPSAPITHVQNHFYDRIGGFTSEFLKRLQEKNINVEFAPGTFEDKETYNISHGFFEALSPEFNYFVVFMATPRLEGCLEAYTKFQQESNDKPIILISIQNSKNLFHLSSYIPQHNLSIIPFSIFEYGPNPHYSPAHKEEYDKILSSIKLLSAIKALE